MGFKYFDLDEDNNDDMFPLFWKVTNAMNFI